MKKKALLSLVLLAIITTGAFAQGFSLAAAGGGLFLDWSGNNSVKHRRASAGYNNLSFGAFGFLDATYAELDADFAFGLLSTYYNGDAGHLPGWGVHGGTMVSNMLQLGFTLLGKYPIGLGGFTLFPLFGADYNLVLSIEQKNYGSVEKPMEFSQFGLLAGAGLDFPFSKALLLRGEALFHIRFPNKSLKDNEAILGSGASTTLGMGPRFKVGLGYRLGGNSGSKNTASSTRSQSGLYMLVNADALNVRKKPSADSALVGTLPRNTRVEVLERSGTWWKIKSGKIQGYVNSAYLKAE